MIFAKVKSREELEKEFEENPFYEKDEDGDWVGEIEVFTKEMFDLCGKEMHFERGHGNFYIDEHDNCWVKDWLIVLKKEG